MAAGRELRRFLGWIVLAHLLFIGSLGALALLECVSHPKSRIALEAGKILAVMGAMAGVLLFAVSVERIRSAMLQSAHVARPPAEP